jgi:hypothetical protein
MWDKVTFRYRSDCFHNVPIAPLFKLVLTYSSFLSPKVILSVKFKQTLFAIVEELKIKLFRSERWQPKFRLDDISQPNKHRMTMCCAA